MVILLQWNGLLYDCGHDSAIASRCANARKVQVAGARHLFSSVLESRAVALHAELRHIAGLANAYARELGSRLAPLAVALTRW